MVVLIIMTAIHFSLKTFTYIQFHLMIFGLIPILNDLKGCHFVYHFFLVICIECSGE